MDVYVHHHPTLTREQQDNFVTLARHLVLTVTEARYEIADFHVTQIAIDEMTGDDLRPDQVAAHEGPLTCSILGHGPRAGLKALPGEDWRAYQQRVFGTLPDSPLEDWLFSALWDSVDNTAIGGAMRLMYVLDYGVPADFELIRDGQVESDYKTNGFLWDRLKMVPPANWRA